MSLSLVFLFERKKQNKKAMGAKIVTIANTASLLEAITPANWSKKDKRARTPCLVLHARYIEKKIVVAKKVAPALVCPQPKV